MSIAIKAENLSKYYRRGTYDHRTLRRDLRQWVRQGKPDPVVEGTLFECAGSDGIWALKEVNFSANKGEIVGIVGVNGSGKSTLLKIISRITAPTSGRVCINGKVGSMLEAGAGFHPELTGRENIYLHGAILGMKRREIDTKLDQIVEFSGLTAALDTPVKRYSTGMSARMAFAVAVHLDAQILLVDEVLSVTDVNFQEKCLEEIKSGSENGKTILFVSHNNTIIDSLCDRVIRLDNGRII